VFTLALLEKIFNRSEVPFYKAKHASYSTGKIMLLLSRGVQRGGKGATASGIQGKGEIQRVK